MPSFDIVSQIDLQEVDNAVNNAKKELQNRYDFRGSKTEINFDKKEKIIHLLTEDSMKMEAVREILLGKAVKRGLDTRALKFEDNKEAGLGMVKRDIKIQEGVDRDTAQKVVKLIKGSKLKVQAAIQEDQVRVSGKSIDDLQEVIKLVKAANYDLPFQFVNMKS